VYRHEERLLDLIDETADLVTVGLPPEPTEHGVTFGLVHRAKDPPHIEDRRECPLILHACAYTRIVSLYTCPRVHKEYKKITEVCEMFTQPSRETRRSMASRPA